MHSQKYGLKGRRRHPYLRDQHFLHRRDNKVFRLVGGRFFEGFGEMLPVRSFATVDRAEKIDGRDAKITSHLRLERRS